MESRGLRAALRIWVALVLVFLFLPIVLIVLYAFNPSNIQSWPITGFSMHWFSVAWHDPQVRSAFLLSLKVGLIATVLALVLGSCVAYALYKFRFFGREAISLLLVLPLALPGIITGIALNSFFSFTGIQFGVLTIVIGHTTFCIVVVYNNLIARLRRTPGSLAEASMDLGARGWQTLRLVTLPMAELAEWGVDRQSRYNAAKQLVAARPDPHSPASSGASYPLRTRPCTEAEEAASERTERSGQADRRRSMAVISHDLRKQPSWRVRLDLGRARSAGAAA